MTSGTPAGWYPNPDGSQSNRYWDGAQWTDHIGPANTPPPPPAYTAPTPASPPPYQGASVAAAAPAGSGGSKKKWVIGGSIAAGVLLFGAIGSAMGAGKEPAPAPTAPVAAQAEPAESPSSEPVEEVVEESPSPTPAPMETTPPADPATFKAQANSHLDDILKDLGDIEVTIEERGFWRLLSNYGELSFNLGQLQALDLPESMSKSWPATLADLEATLDTYSETIGTEDAPRMLEAVAGIRAQVETTRTIAQSAS